MYTYRWGKHLLLWHSVMSARNCSFRDSGEVYFLYTSYTIYRRLGNFHEHGAFQGFPSCYPVLSVREDSHELHNYTGIWYYWNIFECLSPLCRNHGTCEVQMELQTAIHVHDQRITYQHNDVIFIHYKWLCYMYVHVHRISALVSFPDP